MGIKGSMFHWLRADRGQSMVELALILPVMVFGLIGGADMARAYAVQIAVQNGARAAAEAYAIDQTLTANQTKDAAVAEMNRTPSITAQRSDTVSVDATAPFVPLPSYYLLGSTFHITLRGGSELFIQR